MSREYDEMISVISDIAEEAFWKAVAEQFPEIKTGDLAPMTSTKFSLHCHRVISEWLATNDGNVGDGNILLEYVGDNPKYRAI